MRLTKAWIREHLLPHEWFTIALYAAASALCSGLLFVHNTEASPGGQSGWGIGLSWLFLFFPPLTFAYSYPRPLFAASPRNRATWAVFHAVASVACTIAFPLIALQLWGNPFRPLGDSVVVEFAPLLVPAILFIAALFILIKGRSILTPVASVLIWPYWLALALLCIGRWFWDSPLRAVFYFLCFLTPILFAFGAGAVTRTRITGHVLALSGIMAFPWIYLNVMKDTGLGNLWIVFNVPDRDAHRLYYPFASLSIIAVAFVCIATTLAIFRLLPSRILFRRSPLCDRTWPAFVVCILVIGMWFSQSVMPYRIPGAVDYSDYADLQILHVEKKGLQFHEKVVSVSVRRWGNSFGISKADRRWFKYGFTKWSEWGQLPPPLTERVNGLIQQSNARNSDWRKAKPLRAWNADVWYLYTNGSGLQIYSGENGSVPPPELVSLFQDIENSPRKPDVLRSELNDVCLGFCYDPLSAMGYLFANHRCHYEPDGNLICQ